MSAAVSTAADIKMVAVDLDGTLLDDRKQISHRAADGLAEVAARGVKVIIASARPPRSVRHIYSALKLDTLQINYNGALIWNPPAGKPIFHRPLPGNLVRQIVEHARRLHPDVLVSCELLDRWYTDRIDPNHTTETGRLFSPDVIAPLEEFVGVSMTKILLLGERQMLIELESTLGMAYQHEIAIVRTDSDLIQIMDKRVDKSVALKLLARHYHIKPKQILAIGDAPNDIGMLRMAGAAVAMSNGHPAVKAAAHWVAPSNNDHGVHAALVRYGLCEG